MQVRYQLRHSPAVREDNDGNTSQRSPGCEIGVTR